VGDRPGPGTPGPGGLPPGKGPAVEDLLADQRRRSGRGEPLPVEAYLARHPALAADPEGLLDLIYNEVVLREGRGEAPALAEYRARFPDLAGPLGDLFEVHGALEAEPSAGPSAPPWSGVDPNATDRAPPSRHSPARSGPGAAAGAGAGAGWPALDGYEIVGVLGSGGMGVVYRARDLRRGVTVAVKTMRQADAAAVARFKQEFRALLDVSHPNLVALHQLISDGRQWFIVMEYVEGVTFLDHVRGGAAPGPDGPGPGPLTGGGRERLRRALRGLAGGLAALHGAGKLHRDIKPSNVMVTPQGRVVLMDFGLVTTTGGDSTGGHAVGTAAYMAPEQAAGTRVTAASDWYSVGVMIYEALADRLPFLGHSLQVLMDKQRFEPPPPREFAPDAPEDLGQLCVELLRRDPAARPTSRAVLDRLGVDQAGGGGGGGAQAGHSSQGGELPFVGRGPHLKALADALDDVAGGRTVVVSVHGRSGVGKSALVRAFLEGPACADRAVVLAGRCYERESVPYKALDSLIDALGRHLRHLPAHEAAALLPRDVGPLVRVFPVLGRVGAVAAAPRRSTEVPDPQELRRRAFAALRELLARLGDRRPLVVVIDDLQWGDPDSLAVLTETLQPPDPPVLLLVACYRSEEAVADPFLRETPGAPRAAGLDRRELAVGPLAPAEARALAGHLLGAGPGGRAEAVARESGGNPFFVAELARSATAGGSSGETGGAPATLDGVLWSRVVRLPDDARRLLEVVAVSGGPLRPAAAWQCLGRGGDERPVFALLRAARLVRGAGRAADDERVETYHDRVRETVVAHLSAGELCDCHRRLARVLEAAGGSDPETLGTHYRGGGDDARAGEHFARAAAGAAEALAFERAAALYQLALDLLPATPVGRPRLLAALAEALANAGRGAEAARAYLAACDGATVADALEHRRRAAMQFLISGHIDLGLDALRDVLAAIGLPLPRTPRRALVSLLWHRALLRVRGLGFRPRDTSEVAPAALTRVDVCWSAGVGLSNVDWIRGADFQSRGLLLALRAGEPYRVARALAVEAAQSATAGRPARTRTARLLGRADALAVESGRPYALGMVALARGVSGYLEGRWRDALSACDGAESVFRDRCTGVAWELDTAHAYALWALSHLGEWAELGRRFPVLVNEARERGDLYAEMNLSTYILSVVRIADDDPGSAREGLRRVAGQWSRDGYHVQHNDLVWAAVQTDLYAGDGRAAWDRITGHWPTLSRSLLMRVQFIRVAMLGLRARCALAASTPAGAGPLLRVAARDAARLERERLPWADAQALTVRAGLAALRGRHGGAAAHLREAAARFRGCDMPLCAAAADLRLGAITGGPAGDALAGQAAAWMNSQAVRRPDRVADLFAPGFFR